MIKKRFQGAWTRYAYAGLATLAISATVQAAGFPEHSVTLVVPYPPAGTTDIAARTVAHAMAASLGQTIVVENRAGAGGRLGMASEARAKPDGYTIGMGTLGPHPIHPFLDKDLHFN